MGHDLKKILRGQDILYRGYYDLRSGKSSEFYVDIKKAYGTRGFLNAVIEEMKNIVDPRATCFAGMGFGGIPLASAFCTRYSERLCLVRELPKKHGTQVQIEGYIPNEKDFAVIFDDVFSSGTSLNSVAEIIYKNSGAKIIEGDVILKRGENELAFPVKSLLVLEDLL